MKKVILASGLIALAAVSCKKEESTTITHDTEGTETVVTTTSTDSITTPSAAEMNADIQQGAQEAANATENALNKTGAALERGADKVEAGAKEVGQDIKNATDGDGNPNR